MRLQCAIRKTLTPIVVSEYVSHPRLVMSVLSQEENHGQAHLSASQHAANSQAWFSNSHGDPLGPGSFESAQKEGAQTTHRKTPVQVRRRVKLASVLLARIGFAVAKRFDAYSVKGSLSGRNIFLCGPEAPRYQSRASV